MSNSNVAAEGNGRASAVANAALPAPADAAAARHSIVQLLSKEGFVSEAQLQHATRVQRRLETPQPLLHILKAQGVVTDDHVRRALRANPHSMRLGSLLVELGHLREADIEAALLAQKQAGTRKKLGEVLVDSHLIGEQRLIEILADLLGLPLAEPRLNDIDRTLLTRVAPRVCLTHSFIPTAKRDGKLVVAFADPLDAEHRRAAEQMFGAGFIAAIARKSLIHDALTLLERGQVQGGNVDEQTTISLVQAIIREALAAGASDIHFEPLKSHMRVRLRIDGAMVDHRDLARDLIAPVTSRLKILAEADIAEKRRHQGGRMLYEDPGAGVKVDMRASFFVTMFGEKIVLRLLSRRAELLNIEEIGMGPRMLERFRYDALDVPTGVVIITGPTGSGKTTTLYSAIDYLNHADTSIVTAEDPVEYVIEGIAQCSINPKINLTFDETLRHIVRQDPDVIVLGEMRDKFSADTAIQAALTGHKVLTTFHTEDSIGGLLRLMNMEIETFMISSTVLSVVAQRLLRRVCPHCAEPQTPSPLQLRRLGIVGEDVAGANFKVGRGCEHCRFTGYRGRLAVFELLILNEMVKDALLGRKTSYEIRRISIESSGLVTLLEDGLHKAAQGMTTLDEIFRNLPRVTRPRSLAEIRRLQGVG